MVHDMDDHDTTDTAAVPLPAPEVAGDGVPGDSPPEIPAAPDSGLDDASGHHHAFSAAQVTGVILAVGGVVCALASIRDANMWLVWLLRVVGAGGSLGGAWLLLRGQIWWMLAAVIAGGLGLAVLSIGVLDWIWLGLIAGGAGGGGLCAWGYAHRRRGLWFTVVLAGSAYVVAATGGIIRCHRGLDGGEMWILAQGLGSIWGGWLLLHLPRRQRDPLTVQPRRRLITLFGRLLLAAGMILPYVALLAKALNR